MNEPQLRRCDEPVLDLNDFAAPTTAQLEKPDHTDLAAERVQSIDATDLERAPVSAAKRSVSASIFSRLSFSKSVDVLEEKSHQQEEQAQAQAPRSKISIDDEDDSHTRQQQFSSSQGFAKSSSMKQRKRKGSLRKSALLGGKFFAPDAKERRNSLLGLAVHKRAQPGQDIPAEHDHTLSGTEGIHSPQPDLIDGHAIPDASTPSSITEARLSLLTTQQSAITGKIDTSSATLSSPSDHKSPGGYASTTEEDEDTLSFSRLPRTVVSLATNEPAFAPPDLAATSYFPPPSPQLRARSSQRLRPSPLQHAYAPAPEPYSYVETEYWGWVILIVTWLVFTVGMGSALDIWSWAWDVGETPYAPPELEDDPTLPIVGYYPALIVLTGVVAWVWITVAWVGMKYFRHAKIEV